MNQVLRYIILGNIQFLGKYIDDDGEVKKAIIWD
jgi:hypothetical protein